MSQKGLYPCKFVGMHYLHNYLMLMRGGRLDKSSVLLLDIRSSNPSSFTKMHILKSQIFTIPSLQSKDELLQLKNMIHFKHVFLIGTTKEDFETPRF